MFDLQEWGTASWGIGKVPAEETEAGNKGLRLLKKQCLLLPDLPGPGSELDLFWSKK